MADLSEQQRARIRLILADLASGEISTDDALEYVEEAVRGELGEEYGDEGR